MAETDALERYRRKRDFAKTREPAGAPQVAGERVFVVQKHAARRLHYDLRLQFGDTLRSWAVPQGPSLDPKIRRLAVHVEDHPLEYAEFEGPIPKGQYGAGAMIVWDRGTWVPMGDAEADYRKGTIKFRLSGEKLGGGWTLVRIKNPQERGDNWLLIKERDSYARPEAEGDILDEAPESVLSGRRVEEIAAAPAAPAARPRAKPVRVAQLTGARAAALPASPRPQLASQSASAPAGKDWLHEIKLDGYRTMARIEDGAVRLFTRSGLDWTDRYGDLARAFEKIPCRQAVIDGEIVVQDEEGISRFSALQDALAESRTHELVFFAFDLPYLDGYDLAEVPLLARKQALEALLAQVVGPTSALQLSGHVEGHGPDFLAQASRMGLEGVVSKRANSPYRPGRSKTWLKVKARPDEDFRIVGYSESKDDGVFRGLLLADETPEGLRYVGRCGTGFSRAQASALHARLAALRQDEPTVPLPPEERRKDVVWVRPVLTAQVEYATRTGDGILRHSVYKGLRQDKISEDAAAPAPEPAARRRWVTDEDLASVWVTNPDRRMFGADGPTKLELALYYARVGDWILEELALRPVSLLRCPSGKAADCFFQRHAMSGMPEAIRRIPLREEGSKERADYLYVENARGLLALAQFGAVEFHPWGCRVDKPERPDRMVFDLDPDEGLPWRQVVDAAFEVRQGLEDLGFTPFVKTTGGKGLHVVVALARRQAWPEVRGFAELFAAHMARRLPKLFTANMAKTSRRGRIFLDYLRNGRSATAVAAYSLRARPRVPASTPLAWEEIAKIDDPADLNYATVPVRLTEVEDPWAELARSARPLTKEMERRLQTAR
ncbi:MAG TPA: DNA ligase D [Geminicoccaceae bacterium]|nr:DNA ligase D [Geminicoccaceae bacterium]